MDHWYVIVFYNRVSTQVDRWSVVVSGAESGCNTVQGKVVALWCARYIPVSNSFTMHGAIGISGVIRKHANEIKSQSGCG